MLFILYHSGPFFKTLSWSNRRDLPRGSAADLCADLLSNIASEQRAKVVYEYLYRQINDKKVRETIDFLLNREEAHNQMFRDAFNEVQNSGSNQDFGTTKAARMYFSMSDPGPNAFAGNPVKPPKFSN